MADPVTDQKYAYIPLPSSTSIRLLRCRLESNNTLDCYLEVFDLETKPQYKALSYTWGEPLYHGFCAEDKECAITSDERNYPLKCGTGFVFITENLYAALYEIAALNQRRYKNVNKNSGQSLWWSERLWADAVCINQDDIIERGSQVELMSHIYSAARLVIIYLGRWDEQAKHAMTIIEILSKIPEEKHALVGRRTIGDGQVYKDIGIDFIDTVNWAYVACFLCRRWFSRAWVIQEVTLARRIVVLCGEVTILWQTLVNASKFLLRTPWSVEFANLVSIHDGYETPLERNRLISCGIRPMFLNVVRSYRQQMSLLEALELGRGFYATDPRDHVYAVLGLSNSFFTGLPTNQKITPQYSWEVGKVFTEAAWLVIQQMGDLRIISHVEERYQPSYEGLPSWVPDFSVPGHKALEGALPPWHASDDMKFVPNLTHFRPHLTVHGFCFDTVTALSNFTTATTDAELMILVISQLQITVDASKSGSPYGRSIIEALWRTIIADSAEIGQDKDNFSFAFWSYVSESIAGYRESLAACGNQNTNEVPVDLYNEAKILLDELNAIDSSGGAPSVEDIDVVCEILKEKHSPDAKNIIQASADFVALMNDKLSGRRLFRTENGYLGICFERIKESDEVWIIAGFDLPIGKSSVFEFLSKSVCPGTPRLPQKPLEGESPNNFGIVLRSCGSDNYELIGEAYVHSIMYGEALETERARPSHINII